MKAVGTLVLIALLASACKQGANNNTDVPLASVYDKYLYASDIKDIVPEGISDTDSLAIVKDYIDKWVRKQLILQKAEENLTEAEKNVEQQINDYRTSLLVFKYEQNILNQRLDTLILSEEIEAYHSENNSNFILNKPIVKALYIKIPKTAPDINKVRRWYRSDDEEHMTELESHCYHHAVKYDYFEDKWIEFDEILKNMPKVGMTSENILRYRKNLEVQDDDFYYFLRIYEYHLASTVAPLEYVEANIRNILLNKRKIQLINQLESDIYNNALNHGNFNIY